MNIFKNYIGLNSCFENTSRSGFYINQMAGVTVKSLDNITNSENKTFLNTWDNIQERSQLIFQENIFSRLNSRVLVPAIKDTLQFGEQKQTLEMLSASNDYVGVKIYGTLQKYERVYLTSFTIYSDTEQSATFYVYDLNLGIKLKEITQSLVVGFNTVNIDLSIPNNGTYLPNYFLCYDKSLFQSNSTYSYYNYDCTLGVNQINQPYGYSINAVGAINTGKQLNIKANVSNYADTFGFILNFNQICSIEDFISPIIDRFKLAWAYILLAEIIQETKHSERFNIFTTQYTNEELDKMYNEYIDKSNHYLDISFKNMVIPSDCCFQKNERFQQVYMMP